jgi:hypothetical protein
MQLLASLAFAGRLHATEFVPFSKIQSGRRCTSLEADKQPNGFSKSNPASNICNASARHLSFRVREGRMRCILRFSIAAQITTCLLNHANCRFLYSGVQIASLGLNMCCATLAHRPESPYRCGAPRTLVFPPQCERLNPRQILCLSHLYPHRSAVH